MKEEIIKTDVLCIGGGIAGLMAAIRAAEDGAKVVVAEKGNVVHSGRGRAGNDHFWCFIPEVHGSDMDAFMRECLKGPKLKLMQAGTATEVLRTFLKKSFDIVKLWDEWGIPMKYHGRWEFSGHSFPGHVLTHLKYGGLKQKKVLSEKAREKGAEIMNRIMIFDLLRDKGNVIGAVGINTREDKLIVFESKTTIMGTGFVDRLYPPPVSGWQPSLAGSLTLTGDGRAMTFRAGGTIVGPEMPRRHVGPRYYSRYGQATWIGVLTDAQGKPIGPYVNKPNRKYGDMTPEVRGVFLEEVMKSGRGPVYMDCRGISEEDYDYMMEWLVHEGNSSLLDNLRDEGIDIRKHPVEFGVYHMLPEGKIWINEKAETSLKGLYSVGDESMGGIGPAATYGWIAGDSAARFAREAPGTDIENVRADIDKRKEMLQQLRSRPDGPDWKEAGIALQQIMADYAGSLRSETLLSAGLEYLGRLREKVNNTMIARNPWELTRCLETLNLFDIGEMVMIAANERKETRGLHRRSDYPLTDPLLDGKGLFMKKENGDLVMEFKEAE